MHTLSKIGMQLEQNMATAYKIKERLSSQLPVGFRRPPGPAELDVDMYDWYSGVGTFGKAAVAYNLNCQSYEMDAGSIKASH